MKSKKGTKASGTTKDRSSPAAISDSGPLEATVHISSSEPLIDKYRMDQMTGDNNLTDLHLACDDGYVPVHRYLLMGVSPILKSILLDQDPAELAVVHLIGTKVAHAVQFVTLVYYGQCTCESSEDKDQVFKIMHSLGISPKKMQYRKANGTNKTELPELRFLKKEKKEDLKDFEFENTIVKTELMEVEEGKIEEVLDCDKPVHAENVPSTVSPTSPPPPPPANHKRSARCLDKTRFSHKKKLKSNEQHDSQKNETPSVCGNCMTVTNKCMCSENFNSSISAIDPISSSPIIYKPRREFLYQKERDGVLHNVYCKTGHPSKTIYIPAMEDANHCQVATDHNHAKI